MTSYIAEEIEKTTALLEAVMRDDSLLSLVDQSAEQCVKALQSGHKIMLAGNGGSAADAQHLAGEFACRFAFDRPGLPAIALTADASVMTAIANDYDYNYIFARQVEGIGNSGDVFFGLSTSGTSPNVVRALEACRQKQIFSIGFISRISTGNQARL